MLGRLVALLIEIFLNFLLYVGLVAYLRWDDEYEKIISKKFDQFAKSTF